MHPVIQVLLAVLVLVAAVYDILYRRIPNWLTFSFLPLAFAVNAYLLPWRGLLDAALGLGLAILIYMPLYALHGRGAGDAKLAFAVAALVGYKLFFVIFILSGIIGGLIAVVLMVAHGRVRQTLLNTWFIIWEVVHFRSPHLGKQEELDIAGSRAFTIPHGAVMALGSLLLLGIYIFVKP
jgi:prepilin peptidase CpaA